MINVPRHKRTQTNKIRVGDKIDRNIKAYQLKCKIDKIEIKNKLS